ncbi:MAG TPA: metal ABC transporter permease, partial [bacterium]
LILPALATRRITGAARLWISYALGTCAYLLGLALSAMADLSTGAVIVWAFAALGLLVGFGQTLIGRLGAARHA